jgi:hypothetical protein
MPANSRWDLTKRLKGSETKAEKKKKHNLTGKGKGKRFTLEQVTKAQKGNRGIALFFL